jgi:hypothetical protein
MLPEERARAAAGITSRSAMKRESFFIQSSACPNDKKEHDLSLPSRA